METVGGAEDRGQVQAAMLVQGKVRGFAERLLNGLMEAERNRFLGCAAYERTRARSGYRNGYEDRGLDSCWGRLGLRIPRVRSAETPFRTEVIGRYRRYQGQVEEAVRLWVACGMSTRQACRAVHQAFDTVLSATTVSRIVAELDAEMAAFHARRLDARWRYVHLDGVHGAVCRPHRRQRGKKQKGVVLLAWGTDHAGQEQLLAFRAVHAETEETWTAFVGDLEARGLRPEIIVSDGDQGLETALQTVYPTVPHQLCVFHKIQGIAAHLNDRHHRGPILQEVSAIYLADTPQQAQRNLDAWTNRWNHLEPQAVAAFRHLFPKTLRYMQAPRSSWPRLRTNNPLERLIRELNRNLNRIDVFPDYPSWERLVWLTYKHLLSAGYPHTTTSNHFTRDS